MNLSTASSSPAALDLPITAFRNSILSTVKAGPVTILVAETGAGKSTQVPQYLLDQDLRIVVTQPRRMAAELVAERVASERGTPLGGEVGYRLGGGIRVAGPDTRCLFCTEGLALVRELMSRDGDMGYDVLVLDEVHEWSRDMEILVGWARRQLRAGAKFKLVIMSATMEAAKLSEFFDEAPVVNVPGRMFPVAVRIAEELLSTDRSVADPIVRDVEQLVAEGRNVLVFAPGKAEISELCDKLVKLDAIVLPLHGDLEQRARNLCFQHYDRPKVIVSTNVAQTSVTIDDIDAVVDSGLERRTEVSSGVEGLHLRIISAADSKQRRGRAGRTKPGIYIDHSKNSEICTPGVGVRAEWPTAEIERVLLDQAVLRLAIANIDLEELELFHQPAHVEIHAAKETLRALGCLGEGIKVTEMGARISRLPVGVRTGRMLIEAGKRGVLAEIATIAAIMEVGGIVDNKAVNEMTQVPLWHRFAADTSSDHVSMLHIFEQAERVGRKAWRGMGLHGKAMGQAVDARKNILEVTTRMLHVNPVHGSHDDIVKCVIAGLIDQLCEKHADHRGSPVYGPKMRKLGRDSRLDPAGKWLVGLPFDVSTKKGGVLRLLNLCSIVNVDWLTELAPDMFVIVTDSAMYDPDKDAVMATCKVMFRGVRIRDELVAITGPAASEELVDWLHQRINGYYLSSVESAPHREALHASKESLRRAAYMNRRLGEERYTISSTADIRSFLRNAVGSNVKLADVPAERLLLPAVSDSDLADVKRLHPDTVTIGGREHSINYDTTPPSVHVTDSDICCALPDELRTPGGRLLEVVSGYGYSAMRSTELSAVRAKYLAAKQQREASDLRDATRHASAQEYTTSLARGAAGISAKYSARRSTTDRVPVSIATASSGATLGELIAAKFKKSNK